MENMENNVVMENAAVEAVAGATLGQKVLGGLVIACVTVGVIAIGKTVVSGAKKVTGKIAKAKADKQAQNIIVELDSAEVIE